MFNKTNLHATIESDDQAIPQFLHLLHTGNWIKLYHRGLASENIGPPFISSSKPTDSDLASAGLGPAVMISTAAIVSWHEARQLTGVVVVQFNEGSHDISFDYRTYYWPGNIDEFLAVLKGGNQ
ncbi:hypothetical protein [Snodgrassella sp. CFCC 13594]|uniref:hypothetical protein n=1 Tax=Snodgrassella sp. CFCC 13594 TaxID=1775559 RepID=UPI00082B08BA|nr:hypothetical protein [Snodgrassella sp. CFCC 13594]